MAVRMVAKELYSPRGPSAREFTGKQPDCVEFLLNGLRDGGVVYKETIDEIP